ncbi:RNA-directed DNA polymerase, eukaryota [Tanacetum coccineum]
MELAQKAKIKWAIEGDENSKFFHGTLNKKRNMLNIRGIMVDGIWVDNPKSVKREFLDHFSKRFCKPDDMRATLTMEFPNRLHPDQSRDLEMSISNEEIKKVVWECGTDKAPGPGGFTFGFFQHFWYIVEKDVCNAVSCFFTHDDLPIGCNSSFIALILKIPDANLVKDFRPISLIGSVYKIIAKILSNRLVNVLGGIVSEVQSAFVANRQILDGPFFLNEVIQWCKAEKKQTLIFKVDFEKAYDSVRWDFLDDVLYFEFGKGLKQSDPLSPFLFILIMESLHLSFQRVVDAGLFHGVKLRDTVTLSHLFYADDAVFVGQRSQRNISTLTHVLKCFHKASGLKINMCKSKILGIHVNNDNISRAAEDLGCQVLKLSFSYFGSMVGGRMHRLHSWDDMVDRVRNRLSKWKMKMLSSGGRLTLVKSVLGSMPIFHMSLFKVPAGILHKLESIRKHFFNGHEVSSRKISWRFLSQGSSLWARVIKAIHGMDGSIGDIRIGNSKSCWSSIINEINVLSSKGIKLMNYLRITLGNGVSTRLWDEPWHVEGILKDRFPRIYALENCKSVTVGDKLAHQTLSHSFRRLPRGGIENAQFAEFSVLLQQVVLAQGSDRWTWTANGSGQFSVASVRKIIDNKLCSGGENSTRWIRCVPNKINIHAWKVMTESLATRFDISRRGIVIDSILCGNCDIGVETTSHLFFTCDMATSVRRLINRWWEVPDMKIDSYATWKGWIVTIRMASKTKLMFEGVYYVMWWLLWWYRNKKIFEGKSLIKAMFLDDVISKSFYWCRARCKASFSWTDWLKNPHLISL